MEIAMSYELHLGDCLEAMRAMADNSVDSMVIDRLITSDSWARNGTTTCPPPIPGQNVYGTMCRGRAGGPSADVSNVGLVSFQMKPGARRLDVGSAARCFHSPDPHLTYHAQGPNGRVPYRNFHAPIRLLAERISSRHQKMPSQQAQRSYQ